MSFLIKWFINIITLYVVIHTIAGVNAANSNVVIIAALIIGFLNATLRPVLILLTLPLTVSTLGFFTLIINAFMFYLASKFVPGFTIASFWSAFCAGLLFSVLSFILSLILTPKASLRFNITDNIAPARKNYDNVIDVEGKVVDKTKEDQGE